MDKGTNYVGPKKIWVPKSQIVHVIDILGRKSPGFKMVPGQWMLTTHDRGKYMFLNLNPHEGGSVAFGGIGKGKISSIDKVLIPSLASIDKVLYVKDLKYNLLRRCVTSKEAKSILWHYHNSPCGGHYGRDKNND